MKGKLCAPRTRAARVSCSSVVCSLRAPRQWSVDGSGDKANLRAAAAAGGLASKGRPPSLGLSRGSRGSGWVLGASARCVDAGLHCYAAGFAPFPAREFLSILRPLCEAFVSFLFGSYVCGGRGGLAPPPRLRSVSGPMALRLIRLRNC